VFLLTFLAFLPIIFLVVMLFFAQHNSVGGYMWQAIGIGICVIALLMALSDTFVKLVGEFILALVDTLYIIPFLVVIGMVFGPRVPVTIGLLYFLYCWGRGFLSCDPDQPQEE
jgi:hypothetical protein